LLGLERQGFFEKAAFYGGTALRILYGLDRFSEDSTIFYRAYQSHPGRIVKWIAPSLKQLIG